MGSRALRSSLQVLSDQSLKTSRQLDDTYYSILEKVTVLRQTIGSLQELSSLTKDLHDSFLSDTKELTDETKGQIAGFNNFEVQEGQLNVLEERIKRGKEKADALTTRLAEARKRVEARVKGEAEWEAWTNRKYHETFLV
jgi:predicted RNase H-like nuclease (RuvC/YqgF family)